MVAVAAVAAAVVAEIETRPMPDTINRLSEDTALRIRRKIGKKSNEKPNEEPAEQQTKKNLLIFISRFFNLASPRGFEPLYSP